MTTKSVCINIHKIVSVVVEYNRSYARIVSSCLSSTDGLAALAVGAWVANHTARSLPSDEDCVEELLEESVENVFRSYEDDRHHLNPFGTQPSEIFLEYLLSGIKKEVVL